jgi:glycosyltransferase involved in cell wall biosynthesis
VKESRLSILLAGDYPPDATLGSSKVFYKLAEEFRALGHRCDVVFGDEIAGPRHRQIRQVVSPWTAAGAIARRLDRTRYDIIDVSSAEGLWIGLRKKMGAYKRTALICRSNGLEHLNYRRMLDDHEAGITRKGWARRIWYPLTRLSQVEAAARVADRLLLLNDGDRRYALDHGWQPDDRIDVVPHGVSSRFLEGGGCVNHRGEGLLFCGSWDNTKGVPYVIRAFQQLHERGRAMGLTILGPGVADDVVRNAFAEPVRPFIRVVARVPEEEVVALYRTHDVLLWLPTYEGFGLVLLEAMSQELPAVATPVGCAASLVRDGRNALLVPPRDPQAAAAAVERLMDDRALRRAIGDEAKRTVSGMTWSATARMTLDVYARALGEAA